MTTSQSRDQANQRLRGDKGFSIPVSYETLFVLVCVSGGLFALLALTHWDALLNIFRSDSDKVLDPVSKCPVGYDLSSPGSCSPSGMTWLMGLVGVFFVINLVSLFFSWYQRSENSYDDLENSLARARQQRQDLLNSSNADSEHVTNSSERFFVQAREIQIGDEVGYEGRNLTVAEIELSDHTIRFIPRIGAALVVSPKTEVILYPTGEESDEDPNDDDETLWDDSNTDSIDHSEVIYEDPGEIGSKYRECPYCAEPIRSRAVLCRYCGSSVDALS